MVAVLMGTRDESALVQRCQEGEAGAREALVTEYERVVYTVALRMTGDREEARDVTQAVFLKVFRGLATFDSRRRFFSWIYRIAVNESIDRLRSRRQGESLDESQEDPAEPPDALAERREAADMVQVALLELGHDDRQVLVLRHWLDRSQAEIGEALGIPEQTVKSRLFEARRRLGRILRRRGVEST
jgi:RNA polymerase sigma-70 factor, ECF subfamily